MGRPIEDNRLVLRSLGVLAIAVMMFFVWLTYAVFDKQLVHSTAITIRASTTGLSLPRNADVKLRGMTVGEVRSTHLDADGTGVVLDVAMNPSLIDSVPREVTAQIVTKTLFGEKFVALIPPQGLSRDHLQAHDVIDKAVVPIEIESLLDNLYPLLEAVSPAELSSTLSAVATALGGRGEQLGQTLVKASTYLQEINPDLPQLVVDATKLGTVSDAYAHAMPALGRLLSNAVVTGNTVVAKRSQLASFFAESTRLANTLTAFVQANGSNLVELQKVAKPVLSVSAKYSVTFPCFMTALDQLLPDLASAFRGHEIHINLHLLPLTKQPTAYVASEVPQVPSTEVIKTNKYAQPGCLDLDAYNAGHILYTHDNPYVFPDFSVYKLLGIVGDHNKYRAAAADLDDSVQPSLDGSDSAAQRDALRSLIGAVDGSDASSIPDVGPLLISPLVRGSSVSFTQG